MACPSPGQFLVHWPDDNVSYLDETPNALLVLTHIASKQVDAVGLLRC